MIFNRLNLIIFGVLAILIAFLIADVIILQRKVSSLKSYESLYNAQVTGNKVWKAKDGLWSNNTSTIEITKDNLENVQELKDLSSQFEGLKKSLKNLENYMSVNSSTTIERTIKVKDTIIYNKKDSSKTLVRHFSYKDKWQKDSVAIIGDSAQFFHTNKDSLSIVGYWDRSWFLGKKKYFTEIKSYNPNTKIDYQRSIKVSKRKRGLF
jgi:hypothetical protein